MNRTKLIVLGAFFVSLSVVFQLIPVMFSEIFVLATMLSALPIYMIAKMNPKIGVAGYITAATLISLFSVHEGMFFMCTNGAVGLALGATHYYTNKKTIIFLISTVALTIALSTMTFIVGIPVFGFAMQINFYIQIGILLIFSLIYSIFYFYISDFIFKTINKRYKL